MNFQIPKLDQSKLDAPQRSELNSLLAVFAYIQNNGDLSESESIFVYPVLMWKRCRQFSNEPREKLMSVFDQLERLGVLTDEKQEKTDRPGRRPEIRVLHTDFLCGDQAHFDELCSKILELYERSVKKKAVKMSDHDLGPVRVLLGTPVATGRGGSGIRDLKFCEVISENPLRSILIEGKAPVVPLTDRSTVACQFSKECGHIFDIAESTHDPSRSVIRIERDCSFYRGNNMSSYKQGQLVFEPSAMKPLLNEGYKPCDPLHYFECPKCKRPSDFEPWARFLEQRTTVKTAEPPAIVEAPAPIIETPPAVVSHEIALDQIRELAESYGDPLTFNDFTDDQLCWLIEQAWLESRSDSKVSRPVRTALNVFKRARGVARKLEAMRQDYEQKQLLDDWLHRALSRIVSGDELDTTPPVKAPELVLASPPTNESEGRNLTPSERELIQKRQSPFYTP